MRLFVFAFQLCAFFPKKGNLDKHEALLKKFGNHSADKRMNLRGFSLFSGFGLSKFYARTKAIIFFLTVTDHCTYFINGLGAQHSRVFDFNFWRMDGV
jgi:hypothetical protein